MLQAQQESVIVKDIAVLIDRSMSVDPENCRQGLALVGHLIDGSVSSDEQRAWAFTSKAADSGELANLKSILASGRGQPLWKAGTTKVLTASFGSRESIPNIPRWDAASTFGTGRELVEMLTRQADTGFTDKTTFYNLARAAIADRLRTSERYYLFVVSDEYEDLTNCTIAQYHNNPELVAARNQNWLLNPGYNREEQGMIDYFNQTFEEKKLGIFYLRDPRPYQVGAHEPVKVIVYATHNPDKYKPVEQQRIEKKAELTFTSPSGTSTANPVTIADGRSRVKWQLMKDDKPLSGTFTLRAESLESTAPPVVREGMTATEMDLLASGTADSFPTPLGAGIFALTVEATADGGQLHDVAYVRIDRGRPFFAFVGRSASLNDSTTPKAAHDFDTDEEFPRDQGFLKIGFDWEAKPAPKNKAFSVEVIPLEEDGNPRRNTGKVTIEDYRFTSLTIEELIKSLTTGGKPFQGLNKLSVSGVWKDRSDDPITIVAYFRLPKPKVELLGKKWGGETLAQPRPMAKDGEVLKFQNRHHGWPGTHYEVRAYRSGGEGDALDFGNGTTLYLPVPQVQMDTIYKAGGNGTYKITMAYKTLKNNEGPLSNELLAPPAAAYVVFNESALLNDLLIAAGILCLGFFGWHFWSKR